MAPRKSPKSSSPGPGARRETKHGGNKNGKKEGISGSSFFTWFMVIALLGVWTSVAVVWFELVDYEEVLAKAKDFRYNLSEVLQGKLGIYDADGDGDFDVEDAKVLLGLKERSVQEQPVLKDAEEVIQPAKETHTRAERRIADEVEPEDEIESLLHEVLDSQLEEQTSNMDEENIYEEPNIQEDMESNKIPEVPTLEEVYVEELEDKIPEVLEAHESIQEEPASDYQPEEPEADDAHVTYEYHTHMEEVMDQPESPDETEITLEDTLEHNTEDTEHHDYVDERELENEDFIEIQDTDGEPFTEHHYENKQDKPSASDSFTEHIESVDDSEPTEDHAAAQPHETEVPVQVEEYSNDESVDT